MTYIFHQTLSLLAKILRRLIIFYPREEIARSIPNEYVHYKKLRCIVDCTEIFIQTPTDLQCQLATWSSYKHHNTMKFLIAISPQGSIVYLSELWGGRASDKHVVANSSFLRHLVPGDQVMADRGFTIKEMLMMRGAELVMPPGIRGKSQMTSLEIKQTKRIANVRIHVERVIRRVKQFRLLSQTIPVNLIPLCNDIVTVCCAITNLTGPLVKSWNEVSTPHSQY